MRLTRSSTLCGESYLSSIQFLPGERCGNRWVIRVSTQSIGCRRAASEAVLCIVHRHAASLVCRTAGGYNQIGVLRRQPIPHRFDPATDSLEGVAGCEWHKDVQSASPAGFWIPSDSCLFQCIVKPKCRFTHGIERGGRAGIKIEDGQIWLVRC